MLALQFLLGLVLGLDALINAAPTSEDGLDPLNITLPDLNMTTQGYDPSFDYFDYSTAQVWMGTKPTYVGTMIGANLYRAVEKILNERCPSGSKYNECHGTQSSTFKSSCMTGVAFKVEDCYTDIYAVQGEWANEKVRQLLISAVAGALEAITHEDRSIYGPTNCHMVIGTKGCNVGSKVRVNLPTELGSGKKSYLHIDLWNSKTGYGSYDCCQADMRPLMDKAIDGLGDQVVHEFTQWWGKGWSRDSRCIINGWKSC
jgi:hypothetical protein